jgi:hypothetical protein
MSPKLVHVLLLSFLSVSATAQSPAKRTVTFTSVYTSLNKGCKVLKGENGTDNAFLCKGAPGYQVRIYYSAAATHYSAELKGSDKFVPLTAEDIKFDDSKIRLEWRLANGKPFAVIMRVPKYGPATDDNPYFGAVVGERLIVKGLVGFESIDVAVDARESGANAKARSLADAAFKK